MQKRKVRDHPEIEIQTVPGDVRIRLAATQNQTALTLEVLEANRETPDMLAQVAETGRVTKLYRWHSLFGYLSVCNYKTYDIPL